MSADVLVAPRRRGRPPGAKTRVTAPAVLRLHHFQFVRAALELPLRAAWERYLAFAGGVDDERHFAAQLRLLVRQIRHAADQRGLGAVANVALHGHLAGAAPAVREGVPAVPARPPLDEWIAERCEATGIEAEFQTQAEWLADYQQAFGLDQPPPPAPAWAAAPPASPAHGLVSLEAQLVALHRLGAELARPPALSDPLASWLAPALSAALATQGMVSLSDLVDFINVHRFRWFERVPRLGRARAARLVAWLQPVAQALDKPLREQALHPASALALARSSTLAAFEARSLLRFAVVPLERLAVPPELSGRHGRFRVIGESNVFEAQDDLAAVQAWLQRYTMSPRTFEAYGREVERFYLWCLHVARKPLSSVAEGDLHAYRLFIERPPIDWVQPRKTARLSDDWRPFRGPLSPSSQMRALTVVSALLAALVDGGYLRANAARGVMPFIKLPRTTLDVRRSFTDAQWHWLMDVLARQPDTAFTRRTRLALELGATSGLRLIEMATARMGALRREVLDGRAIWMLDVLGKGNRRRSVVILDDIKALIDQHQADMQAAGVGYNPAARQVRVLLSSREAPAAVPQPDTGPTLALSSDVEDPALRPLIGMLKRPPPRLALDADGRPALARDTQADRYGALDPTALYQALKRFFKLAAEQAATAQPNGLDAAEAAALSEASTHWLRHFFANSAAADDVQPAVLMHALGHADLRTTSLYTRPETRQMVRELAKFQRRR